MIGETLHPARDEQLIMNIARGDRDALAEVYLQHKGAVYAFALSILRQAHAAEDVMQETFLQLWNAAGTYVPRGQSALPWLLGITKNTALKHLRAAQRSGIPMEELPETQGRIPSSRSKTASSRRRCSKSSPPRNGRSSCSTRWRG